MILEPQLNLISSKKQRHYMQSKRKKCMYEKNIFALQNKWQKFKLT